jgi:hypothetical protein
MMGRGILALWGIIVGPLRWIIRMGVFCIRSLILLFRMWCRRRWQELLYLKMKTECSNSIRLEVLEDELIE